MCKSSKWQELYMDTAVRISQLSSAKRLQVGAIAVKNNRIISIGYNGTPSGWNNECEDENFKTKSEVIHAEQNLVAKIASSHESGKGAEIYITHSPCMNCAKLIYASGIAKVYYKHKYRSEDGIHFLEKCGLEVKQL